MLDPLEGARDWLSKLNPVPVRAAFEHPLLDKNYSHRERKRRIKAINKQLTAAAATKIQTVRASVKVE
jgi:hypothetical protein